jgi:hypothetical protein
MYLNGMPISAGDGVELLTRDGWVPGRFESNDEGRIVTFYSSDERMPWADGPLIVAVAPRGNDDGWTVTYCEVRWPER